jgi:hypothetical protein
LNGTSSLPDHCQGDLSVHPGMGEAAMNTASMVAQEHSPSHHVAPVRAG